MQDSLVTQGLMLMLAGMGTVFVFLTALVVAMTLMSLVSKRLQSAPHGASEEEVAAMAAAIRRHRSR